jgi:hypothetical protein
MTWAYSKGGISGGKERGALGRRRDGRGVRTLALLLEGKLALLVVVLVLTPTPVFTSLVDMSAFVWCMRPAQRGSGAAKSGADIPFPCS